MKKFTRKAWILGIFLTCLFAFLLLDASAATPVGESRASTQGVLTVQPNNLASAVATYKQNNPTAAQHTITAGHKLVYDADAYFIDSVNATGSYYSCYAKLGAEALATKLNSLKVNAQVMSDSTAAISQEILIGVVDRSVQSSFLPMVDANEFGIMVTENYIILLAWNDVALKTCVETFVNYLSSTRLSLPVGFTAVGVASDVWEVDFVRPTGNAIALSAAQYVNDDSLQFLYTGAGVTRDAFLRYCTQLTADGFSLVWQNSIGNNEFRMYKNTEKGIALYAAYNDYTYKAEFDALYQKNYGTSDDHVERNFEKCIRLISSPLSSITLPEESEVQKPYTKVTDTYMTTLSLAVKQVGAGYVFMLEDGRFIVIDGGTVSAAQNGVRPESKAIWDAMLALYKKAYGSSATPTAQRPIHVAAWYLTHAHGDHYNAFYYFASMVGADSSKKSVFKMDYVIANLPGDGSVFENTSVKWGYDNNAKIYSMQNSLGGFQLIKVHTGQRLHFANLTIEVLMTYEDHLPHRIINTNDTNTVTRFYIQSSGAAKNSTVTALSGKATTVLFLGDSWRPTSRYLCAMYGDYLKSDISQIAHHGNIGCEQELYEKISPTAVLFVNDLAPFKNYVWSSTSDKNPERQHAYAVDKYVVKGATMNGKTLNSVKYVWCAPAGKYTTLLFDEAGAQYEEAFDLHTGKKITYVNVSASVSSQNGFVRCFTTCKSHIGAINCTDAFTCTLCGATAAAIGHDFTGEWQKDAQGHWHVCQRTGCDAVDTKVAHTPRADDGNCTTAITCSACNRVTVAGAKSHTGGSATCQSKAQCIRCNKSYGTLATHQPKTDDGDCTTAITCLWCDIVLQEGEESHTDGIATCHSYAECTRCGMAYGGLLPHTPQDDDGDCTTAVTCAVCDAVVKEAAASHTGGSATCQNKARCVICDKTYGERAPHTDGDGDGTCDSLNCTWSAGEPITPDEPDVTEEGLPIGMIVGIALGAVALLLLVVGCFFLLTKKKNKYDDFI